MTFLLMMKGAGVVNSAVISYNEMAAYIYLLKRQDRGKAFLKIIRKFEQTKQFTEDCYRGWQDPAYPVQLIWGDKDPYLPYEHKGKEFEKAGPAFRLQRCNQSIFYKKKLVKQ